MASLGVGAFPFGLSPAGYGAPDGQPAPGAAYVRTVDNVVARKLDTSLLDVAVEDDETGAPHEEWDPLYQQVTLLLSTPLGSLPFDRSFGNRWHLLTKAPADLAGEGARAAADALRRLTDTGEVVILGTEVEQSGGLAVLAVTWLDARTRRERTTRAART